MKYFVFFVLTLFLACESKADDMLTFLPKEITQIEWGSQKGQVALVRAPANNYSSPRLLLNDAGNSFYLLDSPNQRIVVFNIKTKQFSHISVGDISANDFCVLDDGKHFYLLSNNKIFLYNAQGKQLKVYSLTSKFTPLSMQCHPKKGITFQATDSQFYHFNGDKNITYIPMGDYSYSLDKDDDKQGTLWIHQHDDNITTEIHTKIQDNLLQTLDIVGINQQGDIYLAIEKNHIKNETVTRFLQKYDKQGILKAEVEIPYSLFAETLQDLTVSTNGEVFQIVPLREHLKIVKWSEGVRSVQRSATPLVAGLFSYLNSQPDDFLPSESEESARSSSRGYYLAPIEHNSMSNSNSIMKKAETFANHRYYVNWSNITQGRYGVVTPIRRSGSHVGIPYKWGGFNDLNSFDSGLKRGKYAGDRNTKKGGGTTRAVGVDCSGFVSQVWGLKSKSNTRDLPQISTRLSSYYDLKPGDILNMRRKNKGHVRLFSHRDNRGKFWVYEASGRDWKVNKHSYTSYQLQKSGYKPYRYKKVQEYVPSPNPTYNVLHHIIKKTPSRFYIYGKRAIREGKSTRYRAKILYSDNTYRDVTHQARWIESSRYSSFSGARLYTKRVTRNQYTYVKATYQENGKPFAAGVYVTIRNRSRWRGISSIANNNQILPSVDIDSIHYPNGGKGKKEPFTDNSILYSGDYYQFVVKPSEKIYFYAFQVDSSENVIQLFPMESFNSVKVDNFNPVMPDSVMYLPSPHQSFVLDNQVGEETIYFLASQKPLEELQAQFDKIEQNAENEKTEFLRLMENCQHCIKTLNFWHR